jgi:ATP-binding cassette subfamily C protein CydD
VPQRPHLTQGSLAENLRIANWVSGVEEMRSACRLARLEKWIETLPQGYETQIGEGGMRLSGGQAQRLALARAFIRNAPLLIMDEPTAHLDPPEEALLEEAVRAICRERTSLVIAHRLATIYQAGQIVVLAGGQVAEAGRHEELISRQGTYAQLVQAYGGQA